MKVLTFLFVSVATISAITVPPSWPQNHKRRPINQRQHRPNRNTPYHKSPIIRTTPLPHTTQGDWIPLAQPLYIQHQPYIVHESTTSRSRSHANKNIPFSPVTGSRIHLAPKYHPGPDHYLNDSPQHHISEDDPVKTNYKTPYSEHEHPKDIPTRPIYPGEGQWAKPNRKHKPHVTTYKYITPVQSEEERPDGYDIYERGQERFDTVRNKFKSSNIKKSEPVSEEDAYSEIKDEFVPQKLYAQVRKTETKKHLPRSQIDSDEENADKLREVIKDSKIQTIYTEEGYEDSAYDHAGKEKKAESEEGRIQKAEASENSRRKSNDHKQDRYSEKRGQNRGHTKHRQLKNNNSFAKIKNYDDTETYDNVKQKVEKELSDSEIGETNSQSVRIPSNDNKRQANLHTTKQQKVEIKSTMKNGDDINMEIHTEVKFINGSDKKKHKFVKIVPSYQRVVEPEDETNDSSEFESNSNEEIHRRVKRYDKERLSKTYVRKRPNYYWKRKKTESTRTTPTTIKTKSRKKRYTIDFPNIDVPTIKLSTFEKSETKNKPSNVPKKYPYLKLNSKVLNENSPLRYAENLDEIPQKSLDEMAFYKSRSKTECSEVPEDIDPIPDRIKNMKTNDDVPKNDDDREENDGPRLQGLGDKIDCLKVKYFGEEPLDSPIFKEEVINFTIPPVFTKLQANAKLNLKEKNISPDEQIEEIDVTPKKSIKRAIKTINPIVVQDEDLNTTTNPITRQSDAVLRQPFTLQELTDKLVKNRTQPKSIYDQINLLTVNDRVTTENPNFLILYENEPVTVQNDQIIEDKIKNITVSTEGNFDPQLSDVVSDLGKYSKELPNNEIINLLPENFSEYDLLFPLKNSSSTVEDPIEDTVEENASLSNEKENSDLPTHAALRNYRYFSQTPAKFKPTFKEESKFSSIIFDISKYLPQIKNHKSVTSEVLYKEEIKPSEQLNVYSDVLRSINISTQEAQEAASENSQPITVKLQIKNNTRSRNPNRSIRIRTTTVNPIVDLLTRPEDSTVGTSNNINKINKSSMDNTSPQVFPSDVPNSPKNLPDKIRTMINQYNNQLVIKVPEASQESTEIPGLAPPPSTDFRYRTIPPPYPTTKILLKPLSVRQPKQTVNLFYVTGLRPPPMNQIVMNYNDYNNIRRSKRHLSEEQEEDMFAAESNNEETRARKPIMYTEIVRQRNPSTQTEDEEEEEEDLLPRKRTYEFKPRTKTTTTEQTIEEEEEYYEIEEPAVEKPTRTQPIERPTGLPEYIKLIDKLHEYRFINNITTTLPEQETTTANPRATTKATTTTSKSQTTAESINMGVPAFLQIISALHDTRKQFEPEVSTEETSVEEDDEELPNEPVQNSNPYISSALTSPQEETDEETDPQTHIRNLSNKFRTNIDTSKYKTIERAPIVLRHNLSSRYNAEDEVLPLEKIFTTKMPAVYSTTIRNEEKELILQRENSPDLKTDFQEDEEESITTTKATRRRTGPRHRPTTTKRPTTETTTRVVVRRRRPQRPITTTENPTSPINRRRIRQKLEPQTSIKTYVSEIPPNHKREYVPVTEIARNGELKEPYKRPNEINKNWKKLYDRRMLYQQTTENSNQEIDEDATNEKKEEVEIIAEIQNPNMKHGGNYRHIDETEEDLTNKPSSPRNRFLLRRKPNNRSTESTTTQRLTTNVYEDFDDEEMIDQEESPVVHKPKIIKDPSKRRYFYAKL